jgi:hypothetical protein
MKTNRVWVEIVILATVIACALALLFATLGIAAGAAVNAADARQEQPQEQPKTAEQTYQGMVTCSRCGAKHSAALGHTATTCVRMCVHGGANFVLVGADATYLLDGDLNILKGLAGQRARIVGALNGKTIRISSVVAAS